MKKTGAAKSKNKRKRKTPFFYPGHKIGELEIIHLITISLVLVRCTCGEESEMNNSDIYKYKKCKECYSLDKYQKDFSSLVNDYPINKEDTKKPTLDYYDNMEIGFQSFDYYFNKIR